ncbi:MAG: hypothetical protein M0P99_00925 [Candidatus Cloacimonetes bacterium]|nr:hypothetical protein [Candidatus Cloacimonadota bacterium]
MEIIYKGRQTGKTTKLIGMSAINEIPILVTNDNELYLIKQKVSKSGMSIPEPILYDKSLDLREKEIYVDNAEWMLQHILNTKIKAMTISSNDSKEHNRIIDILKRKPLLFIYKNWKDKISERSAIPIEIWYGHTNFHKENQWFLKALDTTIIAERDFAIKDIIKFL